MLLQAEVSSEDAEALTRQLRLRFYRTCVKDNLNVSEGLTYLVLATFSAAVCCKGCIVIFEHVHLTATLISVQMLQFSAIWQSST